jgi:hypothetical protein
MANPFVGIGTGVAGGAATGAAFGPVGAAIGGGVGGLLGGLSQLLQNSEEAKQKKRMREALEQQQYAQQYDRMADFYGVANDPVIRFMGGPGPMSDADIEQQIADQFPDRQPDWGAFLQSVAGAAGAVRNGARADALEQRLRDRYNNLYVGGGDGSLGGYWGGGR